MRFCKGTIVGRADVLGCELLYDAARIWAMSWKQLSYVMSYRESNSTQGSAATVGGGRQNETMGNAQKFTAIKWVLRNMGISGRVSDYLCRFKNVSLN